MALLRLALLTVPLLLLALPGPSHSQTTDTASKDTEKKPPTENKDAPTTKTDEPAPSPGIKNPFVTIPSVLVFLLGLLLMGAGWFWEKMCEFLTIIGVKANPERGKSITLTGAVLILLSGATIYFLG